MGNQETIRVGGQALGDGVFMRTEHAWAIARADGTIETGAVARNPVGGVPVLRSLYGLIAGLKLGMGKGIIGRRRSRTTRAGGRANRRFLMALIGIEAGSAALGWLVNRAPVSGGLALVVHALPWVVVLIALRVAVPGDVWRYHAAEHKAVAAFEAGVDLDDVDAVLRCSRIHPRCGTNLVFLVAGVGIAVRNQPWAVQVPVFLISLAAGAELMGLAARWPTTAGSKILLAGGKLLQRTVTTAEPSAAQQVVGCRALQAALLEHARVVAAVAAPVGELLEPSVSSASAS